jgi:hypothetical protein
MHPVSWESPPGFKCQTRSTRTGRDSVLIATLTHDGLVALSAKSEAM